MAHFQKRTSQGRPAFRVTRGTQSSSRVWALVVNFAPITMLGKSQQAFHLLRARPLRSRGPARPQFRVTLVASSPLRAKDRHAVYLSRLVGHKSPCIPVETPKTNFIVNYRVNRSLYSFSWT